MPSLLYPSFATRSSLKSSRDSFQQILRRISPVAFGLRRVSSEDQSHVTLGG